MGEGKLARFGVSVGCFLFVSSLVWEINWSLSWRRFITTRFRIDGASVGTRDYVGGAQDVACGGQWDLSS